MPVATGSLPPAALQSVQAGYLYLEKAVTSIEWRAGLALRYGGFYGPGTSISLAPDAQMAVPVRKRRFPIVGDGGGVLSYVHIEDAAAATVAAVERGAPGVYYVVDDDPAPAREWLPVLADGRASPVDSGEPMTNEELDELRPRRYAIALSRSAELHRQSTMNIAITGATGVIGRHAVQQLINAGHRVTGVTRSARGERALKGLGARPVRADVFDEVELRSAFADAHAVVNLLTHIPPADRMTVSGAWDENDRLRREASAAIARAAQAAGAGRLVQESLAFVYAEGGDRWLDETATVAGGGTTTTALTAEANARELFAGDTVVLRFGLFIGPDSGLTQADIDGARHRGVSPSIGRRDAYRPTVWIDDAAAAVAAALNAPPGTYNVVDADPPTRGEIDAALADVVGRSGLRPVIEEIPPALEPVARSQRVSSRRLREVTGWKPRVRGGTEGWRLIVAEGLAA